MEISEQELQRKNLLFTCGLMYRQGFKDAMEKASKVVGFPINGIDVPEAKDVSKRLEKQFDEMTKNWVEYGK